MKQLNLWILCLGVLSACSPTEESPIIAEEIQDGLFEKAASFFPQQIDSCIHYFQLGVPYYKEKQDWVNYVNCHNALGSCYFYLGDFTSWIEYTENTLKEAKTLLTPDNDAYSSAIFNQAQVYLIKGRYDKSITLYQEAHQIEEEYGTGAGQAATLTSLGRLYMEKGDLKETKKYFERALQVRKETFGEYSAQAAYSYRDLGFLANKTGDIDDAETLYRQCVEILSIDSIGGGEINDNHLLDS